MYVYENPEASGESIRLNSLGQEPLAWVAGGRVPWWMCLPGVGVPPEQWK